MQVIVTTARNLIMISVLFYCFVGMDDILPNRSPYIPHIGKVQLGNRLVKIQK